MLSLVELAEKKQLPKHQFMDLETINWIQANKPNLDSTPKLKPNIRSINEVISYFAPNTDWFLTPETINSIHGIRHITRCLVYTHIITKRLKVSPKETQELLIAISLHDTQRLDDKGDESHGDRASEWFESNIKILTSKWHDLPTLNIKKISDLIKLHDVPQEYDVKDFQYQKALDIVKLADALDRYRLPKTKWWINESYLNIKPLSNEMNFAYNLVIDSEKEYLLNQKSVESIKIAIKRYA